MQISQNELQQIINEEIDAAIEEGLFTQALAGLKSKATGAKGALQRKKAQLATKMKSGAQRMAGKAVGALGATKAGAEIAKQADKRDKATEKEVGKMASATQKRQRAQQISTILGADLKELTADLGKFGLTDEPLIKGALRNLQKALDKALTQAAAKE